MSETNLKGSRYWKGFVLPKRAETKTRLAPDDVAEAFGQLVASAKKVQEKKARGAFWLDRHVAGEVDAPLADAQRTLDRAVEGGFFDAFEGRPRVGESEVEVRRAILDEAGALLDDPSVEVALAVEEYDCPVEAVRKWRTRLVACPREP